MTTPLAVLEPRWLYRDGRCVGIRFACPCGHYCIYNPVTLFFQNPDDGGPPDGPETMRRTRSGKKFSELSLEPPVVLPQHVSFVIRAGELIRV